MLRPTKRATPIGDVVNFPPEPDRDCAFFEEQVVETASDRASRGAIFLRIVVITLVLLAVPLVAMQFSDEVNWSATDFLVMGLLISLTCVAYVAVSRKFPMRRRWPLALILLLAFLYVWAELAVGVFTNIGS